MDNKLGIGYITCDAIDRVDRSFASIPKNLGEVVVVNSGSIIPEFKFEGATKIFQNGMRQNVSCSKNKALRYLMDNGCDHIFLIEDDVVIADSSVFKIYVNTAEASGIWHLNYALQTPSGDIPQEPRAKLSYGNDIKVAFYLKTTGAFQYFYRGIIKNVGYFDERYTNAFENVDYLYRAIQKGLHPPFWWFADIENSDLYLNSLDDCYKNSILRSDPNYKNNIVASRAWFHNKFGVKVELISDTDEAVAFHKVNVIKNKYAKVLLK